MRRALVIWECLLVPGLVFIPLTAQAAPLGSLSYASMGDVAIVGNDVRVGASMFGAPESAQQAVAINGIAVPFTGPRVLVSFNWELYTWDAYNAPGASPSSGYWDAFSVTLTKNAPYWMQPLSDPIVGGAQDPNILDVATTFVFSGGPANEEFGGFQFGDGTLESSVGPHSTFMLTAPVYDPTAVYYANFILDTATAPNNNGNYASWGTYTGVDVVVPEPGTLMLLGAGLIVLGFSVLRRRRR